MSATAALPPRFDARDPAVLEDPYPRYAELRRAGALARGGPATWLVPRYADVAALLSDRRLGHQFPSEYHQIALGDGPAAAFFDRIIFYRDPPVHTRLRRLMAREFTPRLVSRLREQIRTAARELLEPGLQTGRMDAIADLGYPLALRVICMLIGIPAADEQEVLPRAADLANGFTFTRSDRERRATDEAARWLTAYLEDLIAHRREGEDLLSRMLAGGVTGDGLTHAEIVDNCVFLFWAGFETVVSLIGTGLAALVRFPEQFERLRRDPGLVPTAVEEFLRYDPPIQGTSRIIREPVELGGRRLRPGRVLVLLLGSANRDERVFTAPDAIDVGRHANPHLSFGGGPHHCLGNVLARAEAAVVFELLASTVRELGAARPPVRRTSMAWMRFHASLELELAPAPRRPRTPAG